MLQPERGGDMANLEGFILRIQEREAIISKSDRTTETISLSCLPKEAREGDFVRQVAADLFEIDQEITEKRQREIRRMTESCMD